MKCKKGFKQKGSKCVKSGSRKEKSNSKKRNTNIFLIIGVIAILVIGGFFLFFPNPERECEQEGGFFVESISLGGDYCQFRTSDFGVPCDDITQCEGICLAEPLGADEPGTCSELVVNFGCNDVLLGGELETLCID